LQIDCGSLVRAWDRFLRIAIWLFFVIFGSVFPTDDVFSAKAGYSSSVSDGFFRLFSSQLAIFSPHFSDYTFTPPSLSPGQGKLTLFPDAGSVLNFCFFYVFGDVTTPGSFSAPER